MKHTPGPWEVLPNSSIVYGVNDKERFEGKRVAVANCSSELEPLGGLKFGDERDANALLIAAAPDLLEALKDLVSLYEASPGRNPEFVKKGRAAIEKAEGRRRKK